MTDWELQMKYRLSGDGLFKIYEKLVERGAISDSELSEWSPLYTLRTHYKEPRSHPREDLTLRIPIHDLETGSSGILRNISEKGLRVAGINARVGQTKRFRIPTEMGTRADPL